MESKSELKVVIGYLSILACYLLGIDVQQIILLLTDAEQYTCDIRELVQQSAAKDSGAVTGGFVAAAYGAYRTYKKTRD